MVDEDHSSASRRLLKALQSEGSLSIKTSPPPKNNVEQPEYTASTAETAVKGGVAPVALIIPHGFGENPISVAPTSNRPTIQLLKDPSDMVAPQIVYGLLQKVAMTSMPDVMAEQGAKAVDAFAGGFTPEQRKRIQDGLDQLRQFESEGGTASTQGGGSSGNPAGNGALIAVTMRDVVGENKKNPMVSFYAAAIGVMFLLFTASGASGSLLDEAESGTLDRVLSTRVTMTTLLAGKLAFCTLLAFSQLVLMFLWAWLVFNLISSRISQALSSWACQPPLQWADSECCWPAYAARAHSWVHCRRWSS